MQLLNKDELYEILTNPTRENFRVLLQNHLGEEDYLDFKKEWPDEEKKQGIYWQWQILVAVVLCLELRKMKMELLI